MIRHSYILALALLLPACGDSGSQATGNAANSFASQAAPVPLGKPGIANGVNITVTEVSTTNQVGPALAGGPKAEAGETFVVVSYTLKNTGGKPLPMGERPSLNLVDARGQTYAPDLSATLVAGSMMEDASGMASDLNPNISAKTKAAWKVDKAAFDRSTWTVTAGTDPTLTFALK